MPNETDTGYMDISTSTANTSVSNIPTETDHAYMDISNSTAHTAINNTPNESDHEYTNISSSASGDEAAAVGSVIPESQYEIPMTIVANDQETIYDPFEETTT